MTSTPGQILSARIFAALRTTGVATAAGVAAGTWASGSAPRIFRGLGGYLSGRNRGRLPFIEFDISGQNFDQQSLDGGTLTTQVLLRAHCGGSSLQGAGDLLEGILLAGLVAIRTEVVDNFMALGDDQVSALVAGPWGHQREASITVQQSFNRADYEVA